MGPVDTARPLNKSMGNFFWVLWTSIGPILFGPVNQNYYMNDINDCCEYGKLGDYCPFYKLGPVETLGPKDILSPMDKIKIFGPMDTFEYFMQ